MPQSLLEVIVCPDCHGDLGLSASTGGGELTCAGCGLVYPVRDGIPVLLVDEARRPL
ncbi:MAG: Trm112 family protein [Nocardioides sp.]|nr:Trm112 family protein [Nocardioides sp.]